MQHYITYYGVFFQEMWFQRRATKIDNFVWKCTGCKIERSIRAYSFLWILLSLTRHSPLHHFLRSGFNSCPTIRDRNVPALYRHRLDKLLQGRSKTVCSQWNADIKSSRELLRWTNPYLRDASKHHPGNPNLGVKVCDSFLTSLNYMRFYIGLGSLYHHIELYIQSEM